MPGFKWRLCNYVGGQTAVKPSFKLYTVYPGNDFAAGEFTVQPRDTSDITISGLDFRPAVVFFTCFRPQNANFQSDRTFGARGGGMSYGVAGLSTSGDPWEDDVLYSTGNVVSHEGGAWVANNANLNDEPPSANWDFVPINQFTGSSRFQQGFDLNIGVTSWYEDRCLEVVWNNNGTGSGTGFGVLALEMASLNADGFTLNVPLNLYDQTDPVFWMAMGGNFQVGVFTAGDTSISGFNGTPRTAVFFSMKHTLGDTHRTDRWDHMMGQASPEINMAYWGGGKPVTWNFTTERWHDADSILFCTSATTSGFVGTSVDQQGRVTAWNAGGVDLQWPLFDNNLYRIGYVLHDQGSTGYLETNWNLRPEVMPENYEPTLVVPKVILMTGTNYAFAGGDPLIFPRLPNEFHGGSGARLGWHIYPFHETATDSWAISTYANSRQERGHYSNSATQAQRGCVMAGAGVNSNPPAPHQHGINLLPNPVIVGTNYRYAERHGHVKRLHVNPSDV